MEQREFFSPISEFSEKEYEREKEQLEKENASLRKELAQLSRFSESCFLPLKPDTDQEKTYSTEAVPPSSTLTSLSSSSASYAELPGQIRLQSERLNPGKETKTTTNAATGVNNQPDFTSKDDDSYYHSFNELKTKPQTNQPKLQSLSEGALSIEQNSENMSTTPNRYYEAGRHVEIGRKKDKNKGNSDATIAQTLHQQGEVESESTLSKKLNFDSSDEDFESEKMTQNVKDLTPNFTSKNPNWRQRVVGEIAFQLDRRILQHVFSHRRRLYGFTVRNISEKIEELGSDGYGVFDVTKIDSLNSKAEGLMAMLRNKAEFDPNYHPMFSELLVNKYGILKMNPASKNEDLKELLNIDFLTQIIIENVEPEYRKDAMILLRALNALSTWDRKPILLL